MSMETLQLVFWIYKFDLYMSEQGEEDISSMCDTEDPP